MKKIIFTESQIRRICEYYKINEDDLYLDTTEDGNYPDGDNIPFNLSQVSVSNGDAELGGEPTSDKFAAMHKQTPYGGFRRGIYESHKKKIMTESNKDLDNNKIVFSQLQKQQLQTALNNNENNKNAKGYDRIRNWLNSGSISYADAYRTLRDHQDKNYNNESVLPSEFIAFLKQKIGNAKMISKTNRDSSNNSVNNLITTNKTPNAKSGTGKGHHDGENINNGTLHYFK